jgi:hypothetical protein
MRKSQILHAIEMELSKSGLNDCRLLEIRFEAIDQSRNKDRLAYCILSDAAHTLEAFEEILNDATTISNHFILHPNVFANIQAAKLAHLQTLNDAVINENNWRGRLFRFEHLEAHRGNNTEIVNFMIRSVWRIIIQRDVEDNYYVRHDIFPFFWSPGHSTGGKKEVVESLKNEFWSVAEPKFHRQDIDFDVVKVFAKKEHQGGTYFQPPFSPLGEVSDQVISEVNFNMTHEKKETCLSNLIVQVENYFSI